jgi:nitroimidazol reductase NimA-like FMN-containing flavoprotein (pyridoxamine 5'-phosphate oxidase superfamily)
VREPIPQAVKDFIAAAPVCRIATVRANGDPHVIPVCPVFDGDRTVYVDLGERSVTAVALGDEPRIAY